MGAENQMRQILYLSFVKMVYELIHFIFYDFCPSKGHCLEEAMLAFCMCKFRGLHISFLCACVEECLKYLILAFTIHFIDIMILGYWCWVLPAGGCWKLSSDKREVFFLFIAIYCLISTQTYCNQRLKSAGHKSL